MPQKLYVLDKKIFSELISENAKKNNRTKGKEQELLADYIGCSTEAIRKWKSYNSKDRNGLRDIDAIKKIAKYFNIKDINVLLKEVRESKRMKLQKERQIDALRRCYRIIYDFLREFETTGGFCYPTGNISVDTNFKKFELYEYADKRSEEVRNQIHKEYFDLKDTDVFDELTNYVDDLYEIYNEKIIVGGRMELSDDKYISTEEDYSKYMKLLDEIIGRYI